VCLADFDQSCLFDPDDAEIIPGLIRDGLLEHEPGRDAVQISEAGCRALAHSGWDSGRQVPIIGPGWPCGPWVGRRMLTGRRVAGRKVGSSVTKLVYSSYRFRYATRHRDRVHKELNQRGFALYEAFRPAVPAGERGRGAAGELDLDRISALACGEP
jgi:hypothetical protein